jgi:hypothetical protein
MPKVPESIREIQRMEIAPEEIVYLVEEMAKVHQERGSATFYTSVAILAERYRNEPGRSFCVIERMRCLAALSSYGRMKGWTIEGTEKCCIHTQEPVFRAVAKCPLKADAKRVWFDPDEFFQIVLAETDSEGSAWGMRQGSVE